MDIDFTDQESARLAAISEALGPWQTTLSLSQILALTAIARAPGLSVNELAENLGLPQQTVSRHVAILLGRYQTAADEPAVTPTSFIRQEINAADPRRRALFLSGDGTTLLKSLAEEAPAKNPRWPNLEVPK